MAYEDICEGTPKKIVHITSRPIFELTSEVIPELVLEQAFVDTFRGIYGECSE